MKRATRDLLAVCEREKLHQSNAIQPFGCLLATDDEGIVTHASTNVPDFLGMSADELLGNPIGKALGKTFDMHSGVPTTLEQRWMLMGAKANWRTHLDIAITDTSDGHILELYASEKKFWHWSPRINEAMAAFKNLAAPSRKQDPLKLMRDLVRTIRNLSGYTKAMFYRFHDDWSGEVTAEAGGAGVFDDYLGLRFPASDIPKIARDLYTKTPYRIIPDVMAASVPLVSARRGAPFDLTYADLRSVSPVHIAYMKNMNVGASLSLPILVNDQLWGLVALHHETPRILQLDVLNECAKAVAKFNSALRSSLAVKRIEVNTLLRPKIAGMIERIQMAGKTIQSVHAIEQEFLELLDASGGAVLLNDHMLVLGQAPDAGAIRELDAWFVAQNAKEAVALDSLSAVLPDAEDFVEQAAGMLAIQSAKRQGNLRMYWFRPALPQEIYWAGNPEKSMSARADGLSISPRDSFKKWVEVAQNYCRPWSDADHLAALDFCIALAPIMLK